MRRILPLAGLSLSLLLVACQLAEAGADVQAVVETSTPAHRLAALKHLPAVLGTRAFEILMASGFGPMVSDLRDLVAEGRIRAIHPEAMAHVLNGAVMAQVMWLAEAENDDGDRLAAAHAALDAVFDGLTAGSPLPGETS